ncbi:MAG: preprotein translocase subunit YajC [Verrucomicrobiales bacterium]
MISLTPLTNIALILAQGDGGGAAPAPGGGLGGMMIPLLVMFAIMYFLIIRPQRQRQKQMQQQMEALKPGDAVITAGGIHGTVTSIKKGTVKVRVDSSVTIEFQKESIQTVIKKGDAKPGDEAEEKADAGGDADKKLEKKG